jgi:hypothetical protein
MLFLFANNAVSALAAPITSGDTTITVTSGTGAKYPSPAGGQYFAITLVDAATGLLREVAYCTARSGDTLTVTRAREGTTARAYALYDPCANLWTMGQAAAMLQTSLVGSAAYLTASDQLGGVSAIQPYAGDPNGLVAGNAATGAVPPSMVWDTVDNIVWVCIATGSTTTAVWLALDYQQGVVFCGTSTGTPNAQLLTPAVPITGYASGLAVAWIAGFTNTAALTINVSGKGAVNVYKTSPAGPVPLTGDEVVTANLISARYDGTQFQLTSTDLGTMALLNQGNTVINPGTGNAEIASPMGATINQGSYVFLAADRGYTRKRSNGGSAMVDTLPATASVANGWWVGVVNADTSANDTISAPAGVNLNGVPAGSVSIAHGQSVRIGFDGTGYWVTQQPVSTLTASQFAYVNISNAGQVIPPGAYEVDSSGGAFTLLLELSAAPGDNYTFRDFARTWARHPVTINANGNTIAGGASSNLDVSGAQAQITFSPSNWAYQ